MKRSHKPPGLSHHDWEWARFIVKEFRHPEKGRFTGSLRVYGNQKEQFMNGMSELEAISIRQYHRRFTDSDSDAHTALVRVMNASFAEQSERRRSAYRYWLIAANAICDVAVWVTIAATIIMVVAAVCR